MTTIDNATLDKLLEGVNPSDPQSQLISREKTCLPLLVITRCYQATNRKSHVNYVALGWLIAGNYQTLLGINSFTLDGGGRLAGDVIHHAVIPRTSLMMRLETLPVDADAILTHGTGFDCSISAI